jgi:thiol-disulfide isomerase/thioredoxin
MHRAPALFACATLVVAIAGCPDERSGGVVSAREDRVVTSGSTTRPTASTPAATTSAAPRKKLCERPAPKAGAKPANVKMASVHAEGETPAADSIAVGDGKWTWINVWAGWCEPCLEEIPLLKQWETKLKDRLRVAFLSVDDDERLASRFLAKQPKDGVRKSHHLGDVDARGKFFESIGAPMGTLPMQILVDPEGVVRCVANGSVQASDLPEIEALVAK